MLITRFEKTVSTLPEVMECYPITGDSDYLSRVAVADNNALSEFILAALPFELASG